MGEEESIRLKRELLAEEQANEEETGRLTQELEATKRARDSDSERFEGELQAAVRRAREEESEHNRCCVCMEAERKVLFLPCRHVCCCESCAQELDRCPVDRTPISEQIRFVMA